MGHHRRSRIVSAAGLFVTASLTLLCARHAAGQTGNPPAAREPRAIVLDMLQSPDAKQQAWGAWYAGRDHMTDLVPAIVAVVAERHLGSTMYELGATDIALDALIQLHATVPPDLLASLVDRRSTQALILASHEHRVTAKLDNQEDADDGGSSAVLLQVLQRAQAEQDADPWFAAANLLLERRTPGFGQTLLTDLHIIVDVYVSDDGHSGGGWGMVSSSIGCGGDSPNTTLPPWAAYELTTYASAGVVVLSTGPTPVYYERKLSPAGVTPPAHSLRHSGPNLRERLRYVAALTRRDIERLPIRDHESHAIKWQGAAALVRAQQEFRADVERRFARMVSDMIDAKVLTRDEAATLAPTITVTLHDHRSDKSVALGSQ